MKILTFSLEYPPFVTGGPAIHTRELNVLLSKLGHAPWVATFNHSPNDQVANNIQEDDGVNLVKAKNYDFIPSNYSAQYLQQNLKAMEVIFELINKNGVKFDLIVAQGYWLGLSALMLKSIIKVPLVWHVHNMFSAQVGASLTEDQLYLKNIESLLATESDQIIPVSNYISQMCIELGAKESKITVIPKALHLDKYNEQWTPQDWETLLYVGRLSEEKGLDTLFHAVHHIISQGKYIRLLIAGNGEQEYVNFLRNLVSELNINRNIAFLGFVDETQVIKLYKSTTLVIVPSLLEAFGRVAIEAMAIGTPVIVSNTGGLGPLVEHNYTGWKFTPGDANELANLIMDVLFNQSNTKKVASSGRVEAMNKYNWDNISIQTINVYKKALRETFEDELVSNIASS
ncbi:glycosyltransferase family 4 protein [Paenibacillus thiaminolyticus]|uniref:glycosyltransferase family 4 protein n=1 Tax=Paenibacillus thiaminolyticus TaxID=49283 RepID=UPI0013F663D4|nr:glycosyltransferase family 4 protein [Paenibacillus thiaminolyticus]NGP57605.1 glycosyltransferase family 4 protein [Paenibacillus thiaminolyticus]